MISHRFVLLAALFSSAFANATLPRFHQRRQAAPEGYRAVNPAPENDHITLRIALTQRDFPELEKAIYAASTPGTNDYGRYLTKDEVQAHVSPSEEAMEAVSTWLAAHGLSSSAVTPSGDWISVEATVSQASQLLQAEFTIFEHPELDRGIARTLAYSVPPEVKEHIVTIHPTISFPVVGSLSKLSLQESLEGNQPTDSDTTQSTERSSVPESCFYNRTDPSSDPALFWKPWAAPCTHDLYEIPQNNITESVEGGGGLWFSGFYHQFANNKLLAGYLEKWRPDLLSERLGYNFVSITGGMNNQLPLGSGVHATSQLWWAASLPVNTPITFMSVGTERSNDFMDWFFDQADYLLNMDTPPSILLHHYVALESEVEPELGRLLCNKYAQLAARGVTLLFPVSMGGVGGPYISPDPTSCSKFEVSFPAGCPFVTSVGGTQLAFDGSEENSPVGMAANNGGFSSLFQRPAYQDAAAALYLERLGDVYSGMFDPAGRAIPDVSLQEWVSDGRYSMGAPSISAGLLGGMIAMINEELVQAGKPRLGFLNPFLYENRDIFRDFTNSSNPGCDTNGFNSTVGWDPVTGLGAPIYPRLRAAVGL